MLIFRRGAADHQRVMPELKNVRIASVGVCTIASPRRLNDVFMMTGTRVRFPNSSISRPAERIDLFFDGLRRALRHVCDGWNYAKLFRAHCAVRIINGESVALSRYSPAASFLNEGAKRPHHSLNFTALLTWRSFPDRADRQESIGFRAPAGQNSMRA